MSAVPNYAERRAFGRRSANMTGYVYLPGRAGIACTIKDISEGGALLEFAQATPLPARVRLMREGSDLVADCEVRHTRATLTGVQFLTEAGRQMAREMFKLNVGETTLPLAPAPKRDVDSAQSRGADLVQRFRDQRNKPQETVVAQLDQAVSTLLDIDVNIPRDILSAFEKALRGTVSTNSDVPLPMSAHLIGAQPLVWPFAPRPMAAYMLS